MGRPDTMGEAVGGARSGAPGNTRSGACAGGGTPRGMCRETLVKIQITAKTTGEFSTGQTLYFHIFILLLYRAYPPWKQNCSTI